jgi:hypothetical protein
VQFLNLPTRLVSHGHQTVVMIVAWVIGYDPFNVTFCGDYLE